MATFDRNCRRAWKSIILSLLECILVLFGDCEKSIKYLDIFDSIRKDISFFFFSRISPTPALLLFFLFLASATRIYF